LYPELKAIKAYKTWRVYETDDDLTTRPGPRIVASIKEYRLLIHEN
jgi:iron complex transport system substrate-binding protein